MLIRSVLQHFENVNLKGKWLKWFARNTLGECRVCRMTYVTPGICQIVSASYVEGGKAV